MNPQRLYSVILGAHVSEKASGLAESANQHVFKVARDASRQEIREAIETIYEVQVASVTVMNVKGKVKGARLRRPGKRPDWKKAYVRLAAGQDLDFG